MATVVLNKRTWRQNGEAAHQARRREPVPDRNHGGSTALAATPTIGQALQRTPEGG